MGRIGKLKRGGDFLPEASISDLMEKMPAIKKKKPYLRLLACIKRKKGKTLREISQDIDVPESTLSDWLNDIQENGLECLYDREKPGRPPALGKEQVEELDIILTKSPEEYGFASTVWTTQMITVYVNDRFGTEYTQAGIRRLLHRNDYNIIAARPTHYKSATKEEIARFEENLQKRIESVPEHKVYYFDESSHPLATRQTRVWAKKGSRPTATINFMGGRVHSFGLLGHEKVYYEVYDELNTDSVISFIDGIMSEGEKIFMILDNASFHKSKKFKKFAEEKGGDLVLAYLPPYTPQLNYIEIFWRMLKHRSSNSYCKTKEELETQLKNIVFSNEIGIPKSKYTSRNK